MKQRYVVAVAGCLALWVTAAEVQARSFDIEIDGFIEPRVTYYRLPITDLGSQRAGTMLIYSLSWGGTIKFSQLVEGGLAVRRSGTRPVPRR